MLTENIQEGSKRFSWSEYLICLSPLVLLIYISNETYAIDYRSFYLAGKSFLLGLNPYLNYVNIDSNLYGPINSELSYYSGWKYPPISTYLFAPLAFLKYEISKNLFNSITIITTFIALITSIKISNQRLAPESIIIALISFPVLANISRGQIDILLVCFSVLACYLFNQGYFIRSSVLIGILSFTKIFPFLIVLTFIGKANISKKFFISLCIAIITLVLLTLALCPSEWINSFIDRAVIPWNQIPEMINSNLPAGLGVIPETMTVQTSDARNLFHSHYFVFGFANPLLQKNIPAAFFIGLVGSIFSLKKYNNESFFLKSFVVMNWINIINPISWIMGLSWYIPLFLYSYNLVKPRFKFLICLPLILPPFLNASGYLAALISFFITNLYRTRYRN